MFLAPSSSRAVDPYLQTLLLRVSLSRLGGKHRQLAYQVGDSVSSSVNSMGGSSNANNVPKGTTLVFGSWACTADGSGSFSSHLVTPNSPKPKITLQPNDICEISDLDGKRALLELDSDNAENVSTSTQTLGSVEFDINSDSEKPHLSETQKIRGLSQVNQTPTDRRLGTTRWSRPSFTIDKGMHQTCRIYPWLIYTTANLEVLNPPQER